MSVLNAVEKVLNKANEPLHYQEITDRILKDGLWSTESSTPWNTVSASLSMDMNAKGDKSRFIKVARGIYGLRNKQYKKPEDSIPDATDTIAEKLSFADATELILEETDKKEPMHYREITKRILEQKLITTASQSPETTLYASIMQENKRFEKVGEIPRFVLHGKGLIGLTKWIAKGVEGEIQKRNDKVREELLTRIRKIKPDEFEKLISILLVRMGFEEVETTVYSGDGGIDVRGTLVVGDVIRTRMAVQVKRWVQNIQAPIVQQLRGSLSTHEQGLIITTSDFTTGAKTEANRSDAIPIGLMDGKQLTRLLIEHEVGIRRKPTEIFEATEIKLDEESDE